MCVHSVVVQLFATPWIAACQAPLSIAVLREDYWSWLPFPTPGDLRNPGTEPTSLASPALASIFFTLAYYLILVSGVEQW